MGNIFAASEVVEIAIQIERNGKDFYDTLALNSRHARAKELFKFLAQEEEKHLHTFEGILNSIETYEPAEAYPGEYFAYMNTLADQSVFTQKDKGKELAASLKNDTEAIDIGVKAEKDSIVFYEGMKKVVPDYDHKVIDEIIGQEQGHLRKLLDLRANL